jgi:hypothetical protein
MHIIKTENSAKSTVNIKRNFDKVFVESKISLTYIKSLFIQFSKTIGLFSKVMCLKGIRLYGKQIILRLHIYQIKCYIIHYFLTKYSLL